MDVPVTVLEPHPVATGPEEDTIAQGLCTHSGALSLELFLKKTNRLLVLVNDATRPTPTARLLAHIRGALDQHADVRFLVATGSHRPPTEEEYEVILGDLYGHYRGRTVAHDAHCDEDMVYLGISSNGTEMYLNRMVSEADGVLVLSSVEPHYFAGYTGGRKSFLPGIAAYRTIEMNHRLAMSEAARGLALKGNPVHDDMVDALRVLKDKPIFSIQAVLTGDHSLFKVTTGDIHTSFNRAAAYSREVYCAPISRKTPIVITAAPYPMDIDLYQSQKALESGRLALEKDGIIILVSSCWDGIGNDTFLRLMTQADTPQNVMDRIRSGYKLGYHKAAKLIDLASSAHIWAVTDLDEAVICSAMMKPFKSIQQAIDKAVEVTVARGVKPMVTVLPSGSMTFPYDGPNTTP